MTQNSMPSWKFTLSELSAMSRTRMRKPSFSPVVNVHCVDASPWEGGDAVQARN